MDDNSGEDDLLVLCSLVEEYKESLDSAEALNSSLNEQLERALKDNALLREREEQQKAVIRRLDDSVNQLMEDLEHANSLLATKDGDLQSLQHCLNVIHRKKVEVDDQTQLEQSKIITNLMSEKSKINEAYSANLKILEEYLDIINSRDSEILDLKHVINLLENERGEEVVDLSDEEKEDVAHRPAVSTSTPSVARPVLITPSPPTSAPPAGLLKGTTATAATKLAAARAASAAAASTASMELSSDEEEQAEDGEASPNVPVTISRNRSTRINRQTGNAASNSSISSNPDNSASSAEQKAAALNKYRRYVALNTSNGTGTGTGEADQSGWATRSNSSASPASSANAENEASALKWSDVGKHERLFNKVDIIKNKSLSARGSTASLQPSRRSMEPKFGDSANDSVNDSMEYEPDNLDIRTSNHFLNDSILSATDSMHSASVNNSINDSVEVFVQIDSNPSSPERMKPAKPLFKPPFSKPTFNEFTPNSSANASRSAKTSTASNVDLFTNKKGASYAMEKPISAERGETSSNYYGSNPLDAKNVSWADSKRSDRAPTNGTTAYSTDNANTTSDSKVSSRDEGREGSYKRTSSAGNGQVPFPGGVGNSQVPAPAASSGSGMNMGSFLYRRSGNDAVSANVGTSSSKIGSGGSLFKKRSSNAGDGDSSPNYTRL